MIKEERKMWTIPDNQIVKIMNRISDIREIPFNKPVEFEAATYELLGTLETIMYDERNYKATIDSTTILIREDSEGLEHFEVEEPEETVSDEVSANE